MTPAFPLGLHETKIILSASVTQSLFFETFLSVLGIGREVRSRPWVGGGRLFHGMEPRGLRKTRCLRGLGSSEGPTSGADPAGGREGVPRWLMSLESGKCVPMNGALRVPYVLWDIWPRRRVCRQRSEAMHATARHGGGRGNPGWGAAWGWPAACLGALALTQSRWTPAALPGAGTCHRQGPKSRSRFPEVGWGCGCGRTRWPAPGGSVSAEPIPGGVQDRCGGPAQGREGGATL